MVAWYTSTVEVNDGTRWRLLDPPCTQPRDDGPGDLADWLILSYDLGDEQRPWRVRVYAGYNRYDDLLAEKTSG